MCFVISGWSGLVLHITTGRDRTEKIQGKDKQRFVPLVWNGIYLTHDLIRDTAS